MREITQAWLEASTDDLSAARHLLDVDGLSHMVAFHCQQCLEKAFKALLEEQGLPNIKTHDLRRLFKEVSIYFSIPENEILSVLNELYVDSRYPGDLGLLPTGKPTRQDAANFVDYTADVLKKIRDELERRSLMNRENRDV